jgi:hypothetical protein
MVCNLCLFSVDNPKVINARALTNISHDETNQFTNIILTLVHLFSINVIDGFIV